MIFLKISPVFVFFFFSATPIVFLKISAYDRLSF